MTIAQDAKPTAATSATADEPTSNLVGRIEAARIAHMSPAFFDGLRSQGKAPSPHICRVDKNKKPRKVLWLRRHILLWNEWGQPDAAAFARRLLAEERRR